MFGGQEKKAHFEPSDGGVWLRERSVGADHCGDLGAMGSHQRVLAVE